MHHGRQIPENSSALYRGYAAQKFLDGNLVVHIDNDGRREQVLDPQGIDNGGSLFYNCLHKFD